MRKLDARQLAREKSLFRYSSALERADFDTVERVLREAERDPVLAQMITEINMVYESETFRLSPSLNHSSNHQQKELLMTTIIIPTRQRNMQRWLPITLAAACVSVLFIGALMLRPIRPNGNLLAGMQGGSTATPTAAASPTIVPTQLPILTPTPAPASGVVAASTLPPTLVPADVQPAIASNANCDSKDAVILSPSSNTVVSGTVTISGIATAPNFGSYKLEIIGLGTGGKYIPAMTSAQAVTTTGTLGQIDLSSYPPENYGLRLSVFDAATQLQASCLVNITLARAAALPDASISDSAVAAVVPANMFPMNAVVITETATHSSPAANSTLGITLTQGVVVHVDQQTDDGQWLHVVLDGGKNGWVLTNTLQLEGVNVQIAAANGSGDITTSTKGIVELTSTLYELPNLRGKAVGTAQNTTIVTIINKSVDGLWSKVSLQDGTQGWMPTTLIQISSDTKAIVSVEQAVLRDKPDANAQIIRTLQHNVILTVTGHAIDTQWVNVILSDGTQGWLLASEVQTEGVPQIEQPAMLCTGVISKQGAQVFSQPVLSGTGVVVDTLIPEIWVQIFDVDNHSGASDAWYYIQSFHESHFVQGWVKGSDFEQRNYCSLPSSPPDQFAVVLSTPVPVATVVPIAVQPAFSAAGTPVCNSAVTLNVTTAHVINQLDKAATIYAAPLTSNSNASVVGAFPAKSEAILLYQQYDRQSDPIGALWYLIMTNGEGDQQVTGWISANSVTSAEACATQSSGSNIPQVTLAQGQLSTITGVAVTSSAQTGTCHIFNTTGQPATLFAAPLTTDSNAPVVGTLPAQANAVVIFQNYDTQSAPIGALWYLVTIDGTSQRQVTGWVSANSINSSNSCAPEQLTAVTLADATLSPDQLNIVAVPSVAISTPSMCQISNTGEAITVFAAPLTANRNAPVVGKFPAGSEAVVILQSYDESSDRTSALWYLITVNGGSDQQLTGWISGNNIYLSDGCATPVTDASAPIPANVETQADVVTAPVASNATVAAGICTVTTSQNESIPVFSGPEESLLVNNLPPSMPATVLYQRQNKQTGVVWYLILAVAKEGKEVSGWVSSDSVKIVDRCPAVP